MSLRDAFQLALRNLRQSKLRTSLTVLGVAIGIASLAGMVSLGVGLQDQFVGRFMQSGMFDAITVMPGNVQASINGPFGGGRGRSGRGGRGARPVDDAPVKPLDDAALAEFAALSNVKDVYPMVRVPVEIKLGETTDFTSAAGIPMSAKGVGPFQTIAHGEFFPGENEPAAMLSLPMANRLVESNPEQLIGQEVTLAYAKASGAPAAPGFPGMPPVMQVQRVETRYRIVGIVERETGPMAMGGSMVSGLMIPLLKAREMNTHVVAAQQSLGRGRAALDGVFQTVTVKVAAPQYTQDVQEQIKKLGYSAFSLNDALQGAKRAFLILDIILGLIGSIALAVASLGIMNTMVMSILERTREIGIMKAIGGSDSDVRRIFLIEASAIGVLGGAAGLFLGWLVGRIINFGANQYIVSQGGTAGNLFSLPIWLIATALGFAVLVSLAAGAFPARRAARLDPIQALRHD